MVHQQHIVNVEGAIWHEGKYLLVIRGAGEDHASGALSFIGGTLDPVDEQADDVLVATLRREIKEEVGVTIGDAQYVRSYTFAIPGGVPVYNFIFLCSYASGDPEPLDIDEVASVHWMTVEEIMQHPAAPAWLHENMHFCEQFRQSDSA